MNYFGDIRLGDTIDLKFTSRRFTTGAPFTLAGSPVVSAYVGNGTTEITAGITLTVDFDGRTGLNNVRVVATSGNGFATATNVKLVITAGTVDSVSVVGEVIGSFSIENRSPVMPTTAGRTLAVGTDNTAQADVAKWLTVAPLALASQRVQSAPFGGFVNPAGHIGDTDLDSPTYFDFTTTDGLGNPITLAGVPTIAAWKQGDLTESAAGMVLSVDHDGKTGTHRVEINSNAFLVASSNYTIRLTAGTVNGVTVTNHFLASFGILTATGRYVQAVDSVSGNVGGSVGSVTGLTNATIADAVWDELLAGHVIVGSAGAALAAAGGSGDPWSTALPGAYGAGTAGKIIGDRLVKLGNEAQGGASATLTLSQLVVSNPSGDAVQFTSTGGNGDGLQIAGNNLGMGIRVDGLTGILVTGVGVGAGIEINGGSISAGVLIRGGGTSGSGVSIVATDGNAVTLAGGANGHGMAMTGAGSGEGLRITAGATGNGVEIVAGSTSGVGVQITTTSGDGVDIATTGGVDIDATLASVTVAGSVTGAVGSVTAGVTVTTNSDKTGYALTSGERDSIATALLDLANGVETGKTLRQAMRIVAAMCGGKVSGGGTATEIFTAIDGSTVRVTATVDASGNRSAMVYG